MNLFITGMFILPSILTISYFLFKKNQLIIIIGSILLPILLLVTKTKLTEFDSEEGNLFL